MIEKMKFLSITGPKADIDRVANTYLDKYEIHLESALSELTEVKNLSPFLEINPYKEALAAVSGFCEEMEDLDELEPRPYSLETSLDLIKKMKEESDKIKAEKAELEKRHTQISEALRTIRPFRTLKLDISEILSFQYIDCRFGRIDKEYFEKFKKYIYDNMDTIFVKCDEDDQHVWGIYFVPSHEAKKIHAAYASMHFEKIFIPDQYQGTGQKAYEELEAAFEESTGKLERNKSDWNRFLTKHRHDAVSARASIAQLSSNFDIRRLAACTKGKTETFYILCGWMTEKDANAFQEDIKNDDRIFCIVDEEEQQSSRKQAPTKLRNPKIFKPFEMYTKMYGLPAYGEIDPTWFVALTYSFIFGAMFGDVGQGLVLLIGGYLLYHFKHMDLAGIISRAGIFSTIFGFLYGSVFGFEEILEPIWLRPMNSMMTVPFIGKLNTVFVAAIGLGMAVILICMIFNIINAWKDKDVEKTWFDTNAVAGLVFYGSVVLTVALYMSGHKLPGTIVLILMFVLPLLVMFLKEPLTNKIKKKQELIEDGAGMFVVQGFFEMFEVILSYFSNTLSFVRIGAFAISHAAMMQVVLMLAGAESGNPNWIVVVLGNLFVCGMEGLVVGIQVLRLEYYEIFSRFYKGNGREFKPFRTK